MQVLLHQEQQLWKQHCFKCHKLFVIRQAQFLLQIAKRLVKIKFISLVNLIMDKEIVKELIQHDLSTEKLAHELSIILEGEGRENMKKSYTKLITKLGGRRSF